MKYKVGIICLSYFLSGFLKSVMLIRTGRQLLGKLLINVLWAKF